MTHHVQSEPLSMDALIAETDSPEAGALIVFSGTVREHNEGKAVATIEYSAYEPVAERRLREIEQDTQQRFDVTCCRIQHRIGPMAIGDSSVMIVVRAPHRADAYEASRYAIDTVKQSVPIWKYETYTDGTHDYVQGTPLHPDNSKATS